MQIIFKANDGTIFYSAEECVQYELALVNKEKDWEAWDWGGNRTTDTSEAVVIRLNTKDAAEQFLAKARLDEDDDIEGIEPGDEGWFYYGSNKGASRYINICEDIVSVFKSISAS